MKLTCPVFEDGGEIPARYAADNSKEPPPLEIHSPPEEAKSLALILEDIDSPIGPLTHWIVWNVPPRAGRVDPSPSGETRTGLNSFGVTGYTGPAPPAGRHHFRIHLLALDNLLDATEGELRQHVEREMEGHIVDRACLTGYLEAPGNETDDNDAG